MELSFFLRAKKIVYVSYNFFRIIYIILYQKRSVLIFCRFIKNGLCRWVSNEQCNYQLRQFKIVNCVTNMMQLFYDKAIFNICDFRAIHLNNHIKKMQRGLLL